MNQAEFENLLQRAIGLDPGSIGSSSIERAVRIRMNTLGVTEPRAYWDMVQASAEELQDLIETVVVPETWFFRDVEAFATLRKLAFE
ncbi:MAG TPA: chemotaxis protein CheR, partial [Verrucomicrobiae bacterium]|nr:chemotaxis protein CheR [Verrucomicrobiae bacterium]